MNLWDVKFDWYYNTGTTLPTWEKVNRLNEYVDNNSIDNLDEVYFKFQKCISGLTYQYVLDLYNIYERNIMVGNSGYTELFYNEYDVINEFMDNFNYVDFYIDEQININDRITEINGHYLKSAHKVLVVGQSGKTENGVYGFDADGYLQKTDDLDTTGQTYRYGCHVKMDNSNNIEFFLQNSGNTFPITGDEMDFMTGHTYILKNGFGYNINNTGTTYDSIPKLWFTDYEFARKLNKENYSLYNNITIPTPSTSITIKYQNNPTVTFGISGFQVYNDTFTWNNYSGKTQLVVGSYASTGVDGGDYLGISMTGVTSGVTGVEFKSVVSSTTSTTIILDEYVPDEVLSGMTNIVINNINRLDSTDWEESMVLLNSHYYGEFIYFSGTTSPVSINPIENEFDKYVDYDGFILTFNSTEYIFETDNHYIGYKLYEHLNDIDSGVFSNTFDLGSGFTMSSFTSQYTYLEDDSSYPQSISEQYSPIILTATTSSDLDNFYKFTSVYINGDYDDKVFVLDKDDRTLTIERPFSISVKGDISSVSSYYSLTGISETLYDVYLNTGVTYYTKDDEFRSRIYRIYNELLSVDSRIKEYTTGTITPNYENDYVLKLYNYRNNSITDITGNTIDGVFYENDYNLMFKPLEIVDIGIDKQTKMPLLIYDDDLQISDTLESGYTMNIIKDSIESNITLVNGMTIEKLKIKYIWVFNAIIEDAIIGEDDYGLVWYKGTWVCGEWTDGTWYSGTWLNGTWKNGRWFSWLMDEYLLLYSGELKKLDDNKKYSIFVNGTWRNGRWDNGIFGDDISISGYTSKVFLNHTDILPELSVATWQNGNFHRGEFKNSIWEYGHFISGMMYGGYWKNGTFNGGTFDGNWWNGTFRNSDFISGIWEDGTFTSSKFGYNTGSTSATTSEWWDGKMNLSKVYSGLYEPIDYNRTHWYNGVLRNSKWHGGHFFTGNLINSTFYNGVFGTNDADVLSNNSNITFSSGDFLNGVWINGIFVDGNFRNGIWMDGDFLGGNLRTSNPKIPTIKEEIKTNTKSDIKRKIL